VLDNDTMADGIPLRLDPLSIRVLDGQGAAFASDNVVRFVPQEAGLTNESHATVEYAAYPDGDPERAQTGRVSVDHAASHPCASQPRAGGAVLHDLGHRGRSADDHRPEQRRGP
jgi:hypothetical protein